jgi:S-adenosylmethionine synthetase
MHAQKESFSNLILVDQNSSQYAMQLRSIVQQFSRQLLELQRDWEYFIWFSPIWWHQRLFLRVENKIPEQEFQREIQKFISEIVSEFELLTRSKLELLTEWIMIQKWEINRLQNTSVWAFENRALDLQTQRLAILEESIQRSCEISIK